MLNSNQKTKKERNTNSEKPLPLMQQLMIQAFLLFVAFTVLFPIMWIVSLSFDASGLRPEFSFIPKEFSVEAYKKVLQQPTANPVSFARLTFNSFKLAGGVSLFSVGIGILAAYAFSRMKFPGREVLMLGVIAVLMLPAIATIAPLFVLLNGIQLGDFNLRASLWGVGIAMTSGALPFAIWNLKGYLDTIPKELEEAAIIDGASPHQVFYHVTLPLARPAIAVTGFLGFLGGWTEFALSWQFLSKPEDFTLAMSLYNMTGQYASNTPWAEFAAMSLLIALPVALVYLSLQQYIVSGLTIGGVK